MKSFCRCICKCRCNSCIISSPPCLPSPLFFSQLWGKEKSRKAKENWGSEERHQSRRAMGWGGFFCHCASGNSPRFLFESVIEEPFSFSLLRLHLPPFVTEKLGFRIYLKDKKWCLTSQHRTLAKSILITSIGMRVEAYNSIKRSFSKEQLYNFLHEFVHI